jgi:hypothetical protein
MRSSTTGIVGIVGSTAVVAALFGAGIGGSACGDLTFDDRVSDRPPQGVVRGTVVYQGPPPCTRNGRVVGNAVLLVFDRRNPPPPEGVATTPVNFGVVSGDVLFKGTPRHPGEELVCPSEFGDTTTVTASAPFAISPLSAGSYILQAFYDQKGEFIPTFKFRNLPRQGDIGGGYVDVTDAILSGGGPTYRPKFFPIDIGDPLPLEPGQAADAVPEFTMPRDGFVAENVTVTLGVPLELTRPYAYPEGAEQVPEPLETPQNPSGDPLYVPVVRMTQDHRVLAPPTNKFDDRIIASFQNSFVSMRLNYAVPPNEFATAADPALPFHFQITPPPAGGLHVFSNGTQEIPEGEGIRELFPFVVFTKLEEDPDRSRDPQSLRVQGNEERPIVLILGVVLAEDSILQTAAAPPPPRPGPDTLVDHFTTLVRPAAICLDARRPQEGGLLVTPYLQAASADPSEGTKALFDPALVSRNPLAKRLIRDTVQGCLPLGRYAINIVYPTGQAWTLPNETGSCAKLEGQVSFGEPGSLPFCLQSRTTPPRSVLLSQGTRAVLEIVPADNPQHCVQNPVPVVCSRNRDRAPSGSTAADR